MTTKDEALKLALEALGWTDEWRPQGLKEKAITALREALASQGEALNAPLAEQPAQQEPEHIVHSNGRYSPLLTRMMNERVKSNVKQVIELYDSPEQPAQPLTDDKLADLWYKQSLDWMEFARAIEAAHGIKGDA